MDDAIVMLERRGLSAEVLWSLEIEERRRIMA